MQDGCGRKIDYLRISVTDRCNLRCKYCIPEKGIPLRHHEEILSFEEILHIVREAAALGVTKVRITGGEPLVRPDIVTLVAMLKEVPDIADISMTTNGLALEEHAEALKAAGLTRVNVSLDSLKSDRYREITRGGSLERVQRGLRAAKKAGLTPIRLNTVLIGGVNDDEILDFVELTRQLALDVRFIELMPIGEAAGWSEDHFIPCATVLDRVPQLVSEGSDGSTGPARYYRLPGAVGRVGLINPISGHFCQSCNRIRLTSDGRLKPCLHKDTEIDLKSSETDVAHAMKHAIRLKPEGHNIQDADFTPVVRSMHRIGG